MLLDLMHLLHNLGIAWGVGGTTLHFILAWQAQKNPELRPLFLKVSPVISKFIIAAVILLIVSGIYLSRLVRWPIDRDLLLVKHITVGLLVLNGAYLNLIVFPKLKQNFEHAKAQLKISGLLSLIFWYTTLVLAVFL